MPLNPARPAWRKSSWSTYNNGCVGVASLHSNRVGVLDTKSADDGPVLSFSEDTWRAFLARIKNGELG
jgi:Domain of unknown function (DUF397)